jgi:hypothetical protein
MTTRHVVVWLDHHEAKLVHVEAPGLDRAELHVVEHLHPPGKTGAHAEADHKDVASKIVGVEAADHPTDGQLPGARATVLRTRDRSLNLTFPRVESGLQNERA